MWRYDATPRRAAAPAGPAPGLLGAAAVAARDLHAVAPLSGLPTVPSGDAGRMEVVVASGLDAPAAARAATAWLSPQVADQVLDDAQLLVSELVTNSVRHAQLAVDATVRVSVEICDGFVRLEVEDPGDVAMEPWLPIESMAVASASSSWRPSPSDGAPTTRAPPACGPSSRSHRPPERSTPMSTLRRRHQQQQAVRAPAPSSSHAPRSSMFASVETQVIDASGLVPPREGRAVALRLVVRQLPPPTPRSHRPHRPAGRDPDQARSLPTDDCALV